MKFNIQIFLIYICITYNKNIPSGVYIFKNNNLYLSYYKKKLSLSKIFDLNAYFRIRKKCKTNNIIFYQIEEIKKNSILSTVDNKKVIFNAKNNHFHLWSFIKTDNDDFVIQNKDYSCFIEINYLNATCNIIPPNEATHFKLTRIYSEANEKTINNELIKKEPIDVLIKYIDLNDPNLNRSGIHQIEKDYDNEELRYSIRSILNNIPWIRKIFILMPNKKVRYFKEYNSIKEKIVYVFDKDFLGYDSSNYNAFLFRYWKMKKFGISDNIIVMDDDYFIGGKLKKNDFFYVKNGKVLPFITCTRFEKIDPILVKQNYELFKEKAKMSKDEQNDDVFNYSKYLTFSFILNLFNISMNENIFLPKFAHNAIPVNLNDVKEIYELSYKSEYKYATLDCLYRIYGYLQFQIMVLSYTFLKYKRKVKLLPAKFIRLNDSITENYNYSLFCINKGAGNYSFLTLYKAKIVMEYLFPKASPYEINKNNFANISFYLSFLMDKRIKTLEDENIKLMKKNQFYYLNSFLIIIFILIIFKFNYEKFLVIDFLY